MFIAICKKAAHVTMGKEGKINPLGVATKQDAAEKLRLDSGLCEKIK